MNTAITPVDPFSLTPVEVWPHLPAILSGLSDRKPIMVLMNIAQSLDKSPLELTYPDPDINIIFVRSNMIPTDLLVVLYLKGVIEVGLGSYSGEADLYIRNMEQLKNFNLGNIVNFIWDSRKPSGVEIPWMDLVGRFRNIAAIDRTFGKSNQVFPSFETNGSTT